eukprot:760459-Hanusia_phi.AAC.2
MIEQLTNLAGHSAKWVYAPHSKKTFPESFEQGFASMISAVYLINLKGEILIYRAYRDDVSRAAADAFRMQVQSFLYSNIAIKSSNVYLVAATRENVNASMAFQFLFALVEVFKGYFGGAFEEEAVRENFPLVYEVSKELHLNSLPSSPKRFSCFLLNNLTRAALWTC